MSVDVAEHGPAAHAIRVCCRVAKAQAKNVCVRVRDPQAAGRVPERTVGPGSGDWRRRVARLTGQLMNWRSTVRARTPQRGLRMAFLALLLGAPRFSCRCKGEDKWGLSTTKWRFKLRAGRALQLVLLLGDIPGCRSAPKLRAGRALHRFARAATLAHQVNQSTI